MRSAAAPTRLRQNREGTESVRFMGNVSKGIDRLGTTRPAFCDKSCSGLLHVDGIQAAVGPVAAPPDADAHRLSVALDQTATLPRHGRAKSRLHHRHAVIR